MTELTQKYLKSILFYDPVDGTFTWIKNGKRAGTITNKGYYQIGIKDKLYLSHRLAWLYVTGHWPTHQIDHIDRVRTNNAWSNLRDVTNSANMQNTVSPLSNNKLGVRGVYKYGKKFYSYIRVNKKTINLGPFNTIDLASSAYEKARRELHPWRANV